MSTRLCPLPLRRCTTSTREKTKKIRQELRSFPTAQVDQAVFAIAGAPGEDPFRFTAAPSRPANHSSTGPASGSQANEATRALEQQILRLQAEFEASRAEAAQRQARADAERDANERFALAEETIRKQRRLLAASRSKVNQVKLVTIKTYLHCRLNLLPSYLSEGQVTCSHSASSHQASSLATPGPSEGPA